MIVGLALELDRSDLGFVCGVTVACDAEGELVFIVFLMNNKDGGAVGRGGGNLGAIDYEVKAFVGIGIVEIVLGGGRERGGQQGGEGGRSIFR